MQPVWTLRRLRRCAIDGHGAWCCVSSNCAHELPVPGLVTVTYGEYESYGARIPDEPYVEPLPGRSDDADAAQL